MRPTLYAGAREDWVSEAANRILPLRCPHHDPEGHSTRGHVHERPGYLYPPMPDWWDANMPKRLRQSKLANRQRTWQTHCWKSWRAMGILEED